MRSRVAPSARRRLRRTLWCVAWALVMSAPVLALEQTAPADSRADTEIRALITGLGQSGCRFQRNGRWYEADQAQAHLQRKYDYARRKHMAGDAEAFIDQAASRSSFSGRAYRVACPGQPEVDAGTWFRARLASLRTGTAPR